MIGDMMDITYGSVCSGIEAASVAWKPLGWRPLWFAEFDKFPAQVLAHHYPSIPNVGDMTRIEGAVQDVGVPDVLVGGTPCQSFSLAGERGGLDDDRGALSLSFVRIYHEIRLSKPNAIALWENVPGALSSRDNAFGCILAGLVGVDGPIDPGGKWQRQGMVSGPMGGAAWRVLDAQYFGVAQQRRRLFVVASSSVERCAEILFERACCSGDDAPSRKKNSFIYSGEIESVSRCLTAGGQRRDILTETFVADGDAVRRLTPIEYERLQGFPDDYTSMLSDTQRYKALGNSMAVPVMRWLGERIQASMNKDVSE